MTNSLPTNKTIIRVNQLGKKYRLGGYEGNLSTIRETITNKLNAVPNSFKKGSLLNEFWALKNITFTVESGEVVGIIGKNGAGKSTLLKILSRITFPSEGNAEIMGRIGSLLEVGTGFHPEMTGRENIFLNGSILGMKKTEIEQKFDEIVKFSEIEKFLDTPVKRYSSGMYIRLAFAVAAHLDPEILIVDEVLAVGDAAFQKKCLGKMGKVASEGKTVLFVTHNMPAVNQLCTRAILLKEGRIELSGEVRDVTSKYLNDNNELKEIVDLNNYKYRRGSQSVSFTKVEIQNSNNEPCNKFSIGDDITIKFSLKTKTELLNKNVKLAVELKNSEGIRLCNMVDVDSHFNITKIQSIETLLVHLKDIRFYPDVYFISLWAGSITSTDIYDYVEDCSNFEIVDGGKLTLRNLPRAAGILFLTPEWRRF